MYSKVMLKCITAEKNDLESTYTKSSIFVANSLTHYKNPMVKFLFFSFIFSSHDFADCKSAIRNHLSFKETGIF
jgi:hypothetical protein